MKLCVCVIRDRASHTWLPPIYGVNVQRVLDAFTLKVNEPRENNNLYKYPSDYELYELGTFDDALGTFELLDQPRPVVSGDRVKQSEVSNGQSV